MIERVRLEVGGARGVLTFETPGRAVNTFDSETVAALERVLDTLESSREIAGLVVAGGGGEGFVSGADLTELGRIESAEQAAWWLRRTQDALRRIERLPFPTVAAIRGAALGGGLELALACRYRIATDEPRTVLGLPEVHLGLCPAAGGCWRLPRQVGLRLALELILSGRRLGAGEALAAGLVDELVPAEVLREACWRILDRRPRPGWGGGRWRLLTDGLVGRRLLVGRARREIARRSGERFPAPRAALRAVVAGPGRGGRAAEAIERREFGPLALSPQSRALVALFFAGQAARPGPGARPSRPGVVGAGLMGGGIAALAARRGLTTRLFDLDPRAAARTVGAARAHLDSLRRRRRLTVQQARAAHARLQPTGSLEGLAGCDLIVEAVVEEIDAKREVFARLAALTRLDTILASNTSTLPIGDLASGIPRPERVVGLHFFSPVPRMPLVEIVRHQGSSDDTVARCRRFVAALGKTPIVVRDGPGFYTTRVVGALTARAVELTHAGHSITEVDAAGRHAGFPVGPLALLDEIGIDVAAHAARTLRDAYPHRFPEPGRLEAWSAAGRLGRKSGHGFYRHDRRGRAVEPDQAGRTGVRPISDLASLGEELLLCMVAEAVRCLEEGVVGSAGDGDLGAVLGLGFPPETGGPFRWIDRIGAESVLLRLERFDASTVPLLAAPDLLTRMARERRRFHES